MGLWHSFPSDHARADITSKGGWSNCNNSNPSKTCREQIWAMIVLCRKQSTCTDPHDNTIVHCMDSSAWPSLQTSNICSQ